MTDLELRHLPMAESYKALANITHWGFELFIANETAVSPSCKNKYKRIRLILPLDLIAQAISNEAEHSPCALANIAYWGFEIRAFHTTVSPSC